MNEAMNRLMASRMLNIICSPAVFWSRPIIASLPLLKYPDAALMLPAAAGIAIRHRTDNAGRYPKIQQMATATNGIIIYAI